MSLFNKKIPDLPEIPEEEQNPLLKKLLVICSFQKEQLLLKNEIIQGLKDEIARLKGEKPKPDIKPSKLEKGSGKNSGNGNDKKPKKRPGSKKRKKIVTSKFTKLFPIHRKIFLKEADLRVMTIILFKAL